MSMLMEAATTVAAAPTALEPTPQAQASLSDFAVEIAAQYRLRAPQADPVLICGSPAEAAALARALSETGECWTPAKGERTFGFVDRCLGADADDAVQAVLYVDRSLARDAAEEVACNLRALIDRNFHDAQLVLALGVAQATGPGDASEADLTLTA